MPTVALCIPAGHPAFAGHFPGRPIVPGVVLLDEARLAIEAVQALRVTGLAVAKFLSPALPGETLALEYTAKEDEVRWEVRCGDRRIASGRFLCRHEAAP